MGSVQEVKPECTACRVYHHSKITIVWLTACATVLLLYLVETVK